MVRAGDRGSKGSEAGEGVGEKLKRDYKSQRRICAECGRVGMVWASERGNKGSKRDEGVREERTVYR